MAIVDLQQSFGRRYLRGGDYLAELDALEKASRSGDRSAAARLGDLRQRALLDNPLLDFDRLILLKRKRGQLGLPTNHQCNSCLKQTGYDNEIAVLSPVRPGGALSTLFRPDGGRYVGEIDLHYDADRLLFTMPNGQTWQIHEIGADGSGLRQVSREEADVNDFDACYLPDGGIVLRLDRRLRGGAVLARPGAGVLAVSHRAPTARDVRQLCFDQDLDLHPCGALQRADHLQPLAILGHDAHVLASADGDEPRRHAAAGRLRQQFALSQLAVLPPADPRAPGKIAAILSGYHGTNRTGELVVLDTARGWREADGMIHRIAHRGEPIVPVVRDDLVGDRWPKFLHPYPLSEKYFWSRRPTRRKVALGHLPGRRVRQHAAAC